MKPDHRRRGQIVRSGCGVLVEACPTGGRILRLLDPGAIFEVIGFVGDYEPLDNIGTAGGRATDGLLTVKETARRASLSPKTLYEWKRIGKLRREHGLLKVGSGVRIEWAKFKVCLDEGGFS